MEKKKCWVYFLINPQCFQKPYSLTYTVMNSYVKCFQLGKAVKLLLFQGFLTTACNNIEDRIDQRSDCR